MKHILSYLTIICMSMGLISCSNTSGTANQQAGTVVGAVAGGLIGSAVGAGAGQALAIGVGAVAGGFLGNAIGQSMDESDKSRVYNTMNHNVTSQPTYWVNKRTGAKYTIVPESAWITVRGNPNCRRFATTGYVNGQKRHLHGIACRQSDGTWVAVSR